MCDYSHLAFPGGEGGLDATVDVPSASVDMPSVDLSGKTPDVPSVGGEVSDDLPSVDTKLTGPDVDVEGGGVSLGAGLAAGVTAAVGAAAAGLGLSGKADKPEGEVCVIVFILSVHVMLFSSVLALRVIVLLSRFLIPEGFGYRCEGGRFCCWNIALA